MEYMDIHKLIERGGHVSVDIFKLKIKIQREMCILFYITYMSINRQEKKKTSVTYHDIDYNSKYGSYGISAVVHGVTKE